MTTTTARPHLEPTDLTAGWTAWHADRETDLRGEYGFLSITAFHWLPTTPSTLPGVPGRWQAADGQAWLTASPADGLVPVGDGSGAEPVDGAVSATVGEAGSLNWLREGRRLVELVRRGGRYAIRVRDPKAPELLAFRGVPAFPVDPAWALRGRFTPLPEPVAVTVETARPDLRQQVTAIGTVEVTLGGQAHTLTATAAPDGLVLAFTDPTNGRSTAPWRAVRTSTPDENGEVLIDFNRTANLPFAFTEFGTCPAPVPGNHLPVAVNAGERIPNRVTGPRATLVW